MSYIAPKLTELTPEEYEAFENLLAATPSGPGEFLYSPAPGEFDNAVPPGGSGSTGDNLGTGAEVYAGNTFAVLNFRTLISSDGSVVFDDSDPDELDITVPVVAGGPDTRSYQSSLSGTQASTSIIDTGKLVGSFYTINDTDLDGLAFGDTVNVDRIFVLGQMNLPSGAPVANETVNLYVYKNGVATGFSASITLNGDPSVKTQAILLPNINFSSTDKYSFRADVLSIIRVNASVITGTFTAGETVTQASSGVTAEFVTQAGSYIIVREATGEFDLGANPIIGNTSGASATNPASFSYASTTFNYYTIVKISGGSPLGVQSVTGDGVDNTDPFNPVISSLIKSKVTLTSAQILALNSTPVQLVAAPGAGKALQVHNVTSRINYATTAYTTNLTMRAYSTSTNGAFINGNSLSRTATTTEQFQEGSNTLIINENQPLILDVAVGNPLAGDGTLDVYVTYTVLTL